MADSWDFCRKSDIRGSLDQKETDTIKKILKFALLAVALIGVAVLFTNHNSSSEITSMHGVQTEVSSGLPVRIKIPSIHCGCADRTGRGNFRGRYGRAQTAVRYCMV
jgi:hypothetical protein